MNPWVSMPDTSRKTKSTATQSAELGRLGEKLAAAYLQQEGFRIVASNFSVPAGRNRNDAVINVELDLIAYEGPILCFVEVKTRASGWFAPPSANVNLRKQRQIMRAAKAYRRMFGLTGVAHRYDVLSIVWPRESDLNRPEIELLRDFWSERKFRKRRWPASERYWD